MKVDLASMSMGPPGDASGSSIEGSLFTPLPEMPSDGSELTGSALLCFLSPDTFVGFVELQSDGTPFVLKLNGSESLTECDKAMCAVQDCCGDKAFMVTAQTAQQASGQRRKRLYLARSDGIGDYVAFQGRGIRFVTDFVPGDEQREQVLKRHFSMLPRAVRHEAVLCLGQMTLHWRGVGGGLGAGGEPSEAGEASDLRGRVVRRATAEHEGYAGDKSEAGSSGDEGELRRSVRGILPMLSGVAIPTPQPNRFTLDELVARGGKLMPPAPTPSAGEPQAPDEDWL